MLASAGVIDLRLVDAAKRNDPAAIRALIKQNIDVSAAAADGATALHWAAEWDDLENAAALIAKGANVKAANVHGATPLFLACANGSAGMVELLLKAGADPGSVSPEGETALMTAARTGGNSRPSSSTICRRISSFPTSRRFRTALITT